MKNKVHYGLIVIAIIFFAVGCNKNSTSSSSSFVGNYYGTTTSPGVPAYLDTFKITSTSNASQFTIFDTQDSVYFTANVSGNTITSLSGTIPASNGASAVTFTGQGSLSGNVLTVKAYGAFTYLSQPLTDTLTFIGTK